MLGILSGESLAGDLLLSLGCIISIGFLPLLLYPKNNLYLLICSQQKINAVGRSPHSPGDYPNIGLPSNVVTQDSTLPIATKPTNAPGDSTGIPSLPPQSGVRRGTKRIAGKENSTPNIPRSVKRSKLTPGTAHVGDHSITATDVSAQIIAEGIDATQTGQGCDILKQYFNTFLGPVPGF